VRPGPLIRERRIANGLTQEQLALRAGSTQAAVSRLEREDISPTFETFERFLAVMGEEADLVVGRPEADHDVERLIALRARPATELLALAISWNRLAGRFTRAGMRARGERQCHEIALDAAAILRALADHGVDYVVIGGVAVQTHGHPRTTQDLDLLPEPSPANLERLRAALVALAARPAGAPAVDTISIPSTGVLELDTDAGGVDVHLDPPGAATYAALRRRALQVHVDVDVLVAGRDDLIAMKRANGRPIDRSDILALTEP
jgi:transcriptional regulator with XRE-family HTH domain